MAFLAALPEIAAAAGEGGAAAAESGAAAGVAESGGGLMSRIGARLGRGQMRSTPMNFGNHQQQHRQNAGETAGADYAQTLNSVQFPTHGPN